MIHSKDGNDPVLEEGLEVVIQLGTLKPRLIAVCPVHRKELIDPLSDIVKDLPTVDAVNVPGRPRQGAEMNTALCKACDTPLKNSSSLASHVRQIHNLTLGDYREQYEMTEEERAAQAQEKVQATCTEEGCDWSTPARPNRVNQVLGLHKQRAHGIAGAAKS